MADPKPADRVVMAMMYGAIIRVKGRTEKEMVDGK
jgi:hypothetical protein